MTRPTPFDACGRLVPLDLARRRMPQFDELTNLRSGFGSTDAVAVAASADTLDPRRPPVRFGMPREIAIERWLVLCGGSPAAPSAHDAARLLWGEAFNPFTQPRGARCMTLGDIAARLTCDETQLAAALGPWTEQARIGRQVFTVAPSWAAAALWRERAERSAAATHIAEAAAWRERCPPPHTKAGDVVIDAERTARALWALLNAGPRLVSLASIARTFALDVDRVAADANAGFVPVHSIFGMLFADVADVGAAQLHRSEQEAVGLPPAWHRPRRLYALLHRIGQSSHDHHHHKEDREVATANSSESA